MGPGLQSSGSDSLHHKCFLGLHRKKVNFRPGFHIPALVAKQNQRQCWS
jgi:hypothetical protein